MIRKWSASHLLRSTYPNQAEYPNMGWNTVLGKLWTVEPSGMSMLCKAFATGTGPQRAVAVWRRGEIRNGHHRVAAAVALNMDLFVHVCEDAHCEQEDCPEISGTGPVSAEGRNTHG